MKYYWVEFGNGPAICSCTIRTNKSLKEIECWVKTWKPLRKKDTVHFISAQEVDKNEWIKFLDCFDPSEREAVIKECTL